MKFNHTAHKELWNWLAENPDKNKEDWPEWSHNGGPIQEVENDCFACDALFDGGCLGGEECCLLWPPNDLGKNFCVFGGLFSQWSDAPLGSQERSSLARQIANLPVKPGVECE